MEKLFENKTKYTQKEYNLFTESYQKEYAKSDYSFMMFNFIFFGICLIIAVIEKEFILALGLIIYLLVYFWFKVIRPIKAIKCQEIL